MKTRTDIDFVNYYRRIGRTDEHILKMARSVTWWKDRLSQIRAVITGRVPRVPLPPVKKKKKSP